MRVKQDKVAVIILNWRNYLDSSRCISSLIDAGINPQDIFLIDNNSGDGSVDLIEKEFKNIIIIRNDLNGGFAYGCNMGIRRAFAEGYVYFWLLNNDTVINSDTLPELIKCSIAGNHGITGSVIRDMNFPWNIQAFGGGKINFFLGTSVHIFKPEQIRELQYITGASMLIKRSVIEEAGLLDEEFFMYWEDVEFCFRASKMKFTMGVADKSTVYHKEGSSAVKNSYRQTRMISRSARRFFRKNSAIYLLPILISQAGKSIKNVIKGDIGRIFYLWR